MNATFPPKLDRLLTPADADRLLRYPRGRSVRLARRGQLPHLRLPDGELRFPPDLLDLLDRPSTATAGEGFPRLAADDAAQSATKKGADRDQ